MRMLDLFSGMGGASEAFVQAGWEVLRLDNDPLRANKKAKIPLELSLALKQAIEQQTTLGLWTV